MRMDTKVHGTLISNKTGREIPEDEYVVFRPHDDSFVVALDYYCSRLVVDGASTDQLAAALALLGRVTRWREAHPERCKVADVEPGELREE